MAGFTRRINGDQTAVEVAAGPNTAGGVSLQVTERMVGAPAAYWLTAGDARKVGRALRKAAAVSEERAVIDHLRELIEQAEADSLPDHAYDQPPTSYVADAEEDFEAAGIDLEQVPWGAIAMRGNELRKTDEDEEE